MPGHIGLPFPLTEKVLYGLKNERLLVVRNAARLSDYVYEITDLGLQRARQLSVQCSYCGAVPVCLEDYTASVAAQSLPPHATAGGGPPPRVRRPYRQSGK